jgi:hypothetical protein
MVQPYPLYDQLLASVTARGAYDVDIKRVCNTINNLSQYLTAAHANEHYGEIQALIIHHEAMNGGLQPVPYGGTIMVGGKGVLNRIENMPPVLQRIIAEYVQTSAQ